MKIKLQKIAILLLLICSLSVIGVLAYNLKAKPIEVSNRPLVAASLFYQSGEKDLIEKQKMQDLEKINSLYRLITGDSGLIDLTEDVSAFSYADKLFLFACTYEQFLATADLSQEVRDNDFSYSQALENKLAEKFVYVEPNKNYQLFFKTKNNANSIIINDQEKIATGLLSGWRKVENYSSGQNKLLTLRATDRDDQLIEAIFYLDNGKTSQAKKRAGDLLFEKNRYLFNSDDGDYVITYNPENLFLSPISCTDGCENPKFVAYYRANGTSVDLDKQPMNIITSPGYYRLNHWRHSTNLLASILIIFFTAFLIMLLLDKKLSGFFARLMVDLRYNLQKLFVQHKNQFLGLLVVNFCFFVLRSLQFFRPYLPALLISLVNILLIWLFSRSERFLSFAALLLVAIIAILNSFSLWENVANKLAISVFFLLVFVLLETIIDLFNNPTRKICD